VFIYFNIEKITKKRGRGGGDGANIDLNYLFILETVLVYQLYIMPVLKII